MKTWILILILLIILLVGGIIYFLVSGDGSGLGSIPTPPPLPE